MGRGWLQRKRCCWHVRVVDLTGHIVSSTLSTAELFSRQTWPPQKTCNSLRVVLWPLHTHTMALLTHTIRNLHTKNLKSFSDWLYTVIHPIAIKTNKETKPLILTCLCFSNCGTQSCSSNRKPGKQVVGLLVRQRQISADQHLWLSSSRWFQCALAPSAAGGTGGKETATSLFRRSGLAQWGMGWEQAWSENYSSGDEVRANERSF